MRESCLLFIRVVFRINLHLLQNRFYLTYRQYLLHNEIHTVFNIGPDTLQEPHSIIKRGNSRYKKHELI